MWTPTPRRQHSRDGLRYETDLTDAEWAIVEPLMPGPRPCGRPRAWALRQIINAIFYVLRGGIAWRLISCLRTCRRRVSLVRAVARHRPV
jgi:transposase